MLRQAQHELSNTAGPELVVLRQAQHERGIVVRFFVKLRITWAQKHSDDFYQNIASQFAKLPTKSPYSPYFLQVSVEIHI